jgi:tellurite resistance protein
MTEKPMPPSQILGTVVLRFLARVAVADEIIDPNEVDLLVHLAGTMGLPAEEARRILDDELITRSDAEVLAKQLPDPAHLRSVYGLGCMMALSEGHLADAERDVLAAFARGGGISEAEASAILDEVTASMV